MPVQGRPQLGHLGWYHERPIAVQRHWLMQHLSNPGLQQRTPALLPALACESLRQAGGWLDFGASCKLGLLGRLGLGQARLNVQPLQSCRYQYAKQEETTRETVLSALAAHSCKSKLH